MARSRTAMDWALLDRLAQFPLRAEDIAFILGGISVDTLSRRVQERYGVTLKDYLRRRQIQLKAGLRAAQWRSAMRGNIRMLIWLGKNYLGQSTEGPRVCSECGVALPRDTRR